MKMLKKAASIVLASAMVVSLAACGSSNDKGSSADTDTFKIGGIGPITGGAAIYGQAVMNAAQMAVDKINADGGINGYQVEFRFEDDEHDAEKSVNAYNTLKDWGMQMLMATVTSTPCVSVAAKTAEEKCFKVIIAGAGMAAHLPGMCAAIFPMPVIGIPMHTTSLGGRDSLYSIVQMPSGIPVATVAINGGANAGLLAAKILATSDAELLSRLKAYSQDLKEQVEKKDARLQEVGYKNYAK